MGELVEVNDTEIVLPGQLIREQKAILKGNLVEA